MGAELQAELVNLDVNAEELSGVWNYTGTPFTIFPKRSSMILPRVYAVHNSIYVWELSGMATYSWCLGHVLVPTLPLVWNLTLTVQDLIVKGLVELAHIPTYRTSAPAHHRSGIECLS